VGRGTRPEEYHCHGASILAAADGTVVATEDRIHTAPLVGWGVCDFLARSFLGNHVMIHHAEGEFALYAHLSRGSVLVRPGDRVARGQPLGRCGHTGHSTEPHLHFHLQDSPDPFAGMGLPIRFEALEVDGVPSGEAHLTAGQRVRSEDPSGNADAADARR
jgi:murein DD-endopeptidase MepM/ murein hydrolase activator NlpD